MDIDPENFKNLQRKYFKNANREKFFWRTANSYIRNKELELLRPLLNNGDHNILEVGCGEGSNLANFKQICNYDCTLFGIDRSFNMIAFAKDNVPASLVCTDALSLPFIDGQFDLVFAKDLFHHLPVEQQEAAAEEMLRVCKKAGRVVFIEENGRFNPFLFIFSILVRGEKGGLKMSSGRIEEIISKLDKIKNVFIKMAEPSSFFRFFLHYKYGFGRYGLKLTPVVKCLDRIMGWINFKKCYGYILAVITKSA